MKKIIKIIGIALGVSLLIASLLIFIGWLHYSNIVNKVPSNQNEKFESGKYGKYVNNFIGTGGFPAWVGGMNFPGATVPFGMVRLSPETISTFPDNNLLIPNKKALSTSGYYYADNRMLGFSHTRLAGTGATDGGHFLFTPTNQAADDINFKKDYYHKFSHENEIAFPGYYSVKFKKENIFSELTATERTGLHRYTFQKEDAKNILIKITNTTGDKPAKEGEVSVYPSKNTVEGSVRTFGTFAGRYKGQKVYFVAKFSQNINTYGIWDGSKFIANKKNRSGDNLVLHIGFNPENPNQTIHVKVGISYVSLQNAKLNLGTEAANQSFDATVKKAQVKWENKFSLIKVNGATEIDKNIFYSALYRSFQMPTLFNDVNGEYLGFDNKIHQATDFNYYTDLSLWDTFRTIHPLFNLIAKEEQRDMIVSLIQMARQGGSFPRWPSGNGYTGSMLGSPADMTITESYLKGIRDFDIDFAFDKMKAVALAPTPKNSEASGRRSIEGYIKYGYCPDELGDKSVGKTLEYAWADYSISLLAKALGSDDDYQFFTKQSKNYIHVWNPETQYFQSRRIDGSFVEKFDPLQLTYTDWDKEYTKGYVEGSALQWRWMVPFDPKGLISLFDSNDYFVSELNDFFALSKPQLATWIPDNYYWHGNEPDLHAVYLFNEAGRPDLTQKWVRWILKNKYEDDYVGIDGNDDAGTLSAWYIFSALGIYPIAGTTIYQLGSPLFESAKINLGANNLNIETENYSKENIYVKAVYLNGDLLNRHWIDHKEIANGGILKFVMRKKPILENK
ncbi:MAG: GH92 family glycosyl hydrolase [Flavobacteriaceae bacterium]|nr:GH92 family glycosyl hydrolase [Flavobacteriaceae bacterium]